MTTPALLVDTNVFIACESIDEDDVHVNAATAVEMVNEANSLGYELWIGPGTVADIERDSNEARRNASRLQLRKWRILGSVPIGDLTTRAGYTEPLSPNDRCDLEMLAGLESNAVEHLITEDEGLRKKARNAGLSDRVMSLTGALEYLRKLNGSPTLLPNVDWGRAYQISATDPILESLRGDYDGFDDWFDKIRKERRPCCVLGSFARGIEAIAIFKEELDRPYGLDGTVLKICTFKVAEWYQGSKRGEALMRAALNHASTSGYDIAYVEVFDKHKPVVDLFEAFGFHDSGERNDRGELVLAKSIRRPASENELTPLQFHIDYGPPALIVHDPHVIPVQPAWHGTLFPETASQHSLFGPEPVGYAIRKAYLSLSAITPPAPGSTLLFYRSGPGAAVTIIGVTEQARRFESPAEIRRFVGQRTVYTDRDIADLCRRARHGVLAVLFRQDRVLPSTWGRPLLIEAGVVNGPPQSIQRVASKEGIEWISAHVDDKP